MAWKYYRKGKLKAECNDITPETVEDAVRELRENGVDVSDCTVDNGAYIDDFWSPDYPPEEAEYQDTITFKPLSNKELAQYEECISILKEKIPLKVSSDFNDKLWAKINALKGEATMKPTRFKLTNTLNNYIDKLYHWCKKWTDEEVSYLIFWIITIYVMIGVVKYEPKMIEIILWPFM